MKLPPLLRIEQLVQLSFDDRKAIADAVARTIVVGPREDLVREGDRPADYYLVIDGLLCRYKLMAEGKRQIVGFNIAGDLCDISGGVMGRMDHSMASVTSSVLAVIPRAALHYLIDRHPQIGLALWKETIVDAAIAREWVVNVGRRSALERIAHLFCEMGRRLRAVERARDGRFAWPVTQAEVADAMGLSAVHVNRVYQQLRGDGLIATEGDHVHVLDWQRLEEIGEFRPDYLFLAQPQQDQERTSS